ncbi:ribonuclease P protein component [Phaeovibrio sulfidiphilus]|uniref:ribonuclease P protein component n=1 Tax=Phaeovibrio sulfidiphilus TaxID=1220600 RepID=UPI0030842AA0
MSEDGRPETVPAPTPQPDAKPRHDLQRLKRRADFLRVASRRTKWVTSGFILQAAPTPPPRVRPGEPPSPEPAGPVIRIGFTTSKKVGKAVQRNRARRRLRAIASEIMGTDAQAGYDYVLIGRTETIARPYEMLLSDLRWALKRLGLRR